MNASDRDDVRMPYERSGMVPWDDVSVFVQSWNGVAATLIDRHLNVSSSSELAIALFPRLREGVNLAREFFLNASRYESDCADRISQQVVAALHASLAWHEQDPEFEEIVGELSAMSGAFSDAWANDPQALRPHGVLRVLHTTEGEVAIKYQLLELMSGRNDVLIIWRGADADSESALQRLAASA